MGKARSLREATIKLAQIKTGDAVLDVGCGTGDLTIAARLQTGPTGQVYGIDAANEMIDVARRKAARAGIKVDFNPGLIEKLNYADNTFDVVMTSLVMHHLPDDLKLVGLGEIYRVLKPGGSLLIIEFARSPISLHKLVNNAMMHRAQGADLGGIPEMMRKVGFRNIEEGLAGGSLLGYARGLAIK
jgi:ubiquinone/menaquinone biosynthesis C-methylase UbiE